MSSYVVSLSGGKDSTAMLLMMLERGENVSDIVFFDTGWEFPQMYEHLGQLEKFIGRKITVLRPREPFNYVFADRPVISRKTKQVDRLGRGWPSGNRRWCTRLKLDAINAHAQALSYRGGVNLPVTDCVGLAADEMHRVPTKRRTLKYVKKRYPLIEWGVTEAHALTYCRQRGFTWGGLYDVFPRVSCFCCPLGGIKSARKLWRYYPALWQKMLDMENWLPVNDIGRRFAGEKTLSDLQARFERETNFPLLKALQHCSAGQAMRFNR